jgi:hypothetical protein
MRLPRSALHSSALSLVALAVIGLATTAQSLTTQLYPEVTLRGGQEQAVPDTGITLLLTGITDQRCPPKVDCFWEGMIRAEISVADGAETQQIVLCNLCDDGTRSATAAGLTLTLVSLAPSTDELAKLGRAPVLADYALTVSYAPATN